MGAEPQTRRGGQEGVDGLNACGTRNAKKFGTPGHLCGQQAVLLTTACACYSSSCVSWLARAQAGQVLLQGTGLLEFVILLDQNTISSLLSHQLAEPNHRPTVTESAP